MTTKLRAILIGAGAACVVAVLALILYGGGQHRRYLEAQGAARILTAEYEMYRTRADAAVVALNASIADAIKQRDEALAQAAQAHAQQTAIQSKYDKLKGETAALPPDALSGAINVRIGADESRPMANGLFSFSRVGTERTLNLFLDGESTRALYAAEQVATANLTRALDSAAVEVQGWTDKCALKAGELEKALEAWGAEHDALLYLRRSIFGRKTRAFVIGAGVGAVAVIVYTVIKGN